jgi:hypothetical protein
MKTLAALSAVLALTACGEAQAPEAPVVRATQAERDYQEIATAVVKAACSNSLKDRAEGVADVASVTKDLDPGDSEDGPDVPQEVRVLTKEIAESGCP